ncbi:response regulator transcription factor [Paenarthrobacter nicotinovorans]|uniref:response regulator transcription factor n=1 Tax=Paenarthrobacter nicotinovorans TaxID=29320 RepID=UPI003A80F04C
MGAPALRNNHPASCIDGCPVDTAQQTRPDLITLDLGLPDMAGHDVAGRLRELTDAPILIITAFAETADELTAIAAGSRAYLAKPFRPAELRTLIRALCPPPDDAPAPQPPRTHARHSTYPSTTSAPVTP